MSQIEITRSPAAPDIPAARAVYEAALAQAGAHRAVVLQVRADELARHIRRAGSRSAEPSASGHAAEYWLRTHLRQGDDALKRAAIAALALGLDRRIARLPAAVRAVYPLAHARLAASLRTQRAYGFDTFARDAALVSGLAVPAGALSVFAPELHCPESMPLRARRAAGGFARQAMQWGSQAAGGWLADAGARAWAELHLDVRALAEFNVEGFVRSYHVVAALLRARPDLAGLYGASWLYDPRLAAISPGLAFVRRTAEDGGGRIVRLKVDPVQTAFAVARSPDRRKLVESGAYRPACYAMYWSAADLIAWSEHDRPPEPAAPQMQVVLK